VEKGVLFKADIDERGLEVMFEVLDAAFKDTTDETFLGGVFHLKLLDMVIFDYSNACFKFFGINYNLTFGLSITEEF